MYILLIYFSDLGNILDIFYTVSHLALLHNLGDKRMSQYDSNEL